MKHRKSKADHTNSGPLDGISKAVTELNSQVPEMANFLLNQKLPILIIGGSGTGKRLLAEAVGQTAAKISNRKFGTVDLNILEPNLIRSELFGHKKGAFTGADRDKTGMLKEYENGILFIDEIGNLPKYIQNILLMALDGTLLRPVGGNESDEFAITPYLIFATNKNPEDENIFNRDFYYRISSCREDIPNLDKRRIDIIFLIKKIIDECNLSTKPERLKWSHTDWYCLLEYDWGEGGYRQLRKEILHLWRKGRLSAEFHRNFRTYHRRKYAEAKRLERLAELQNMQRLSEFCSGPELEDEKKSIAKSISADPQIDPDLPIYLEGDLPIERELIGRQFFFSADELLNYARKEVEYYDVHDSPWPDPRDNFDHIAFLMNLIHRQQKWGLKNYIPYISYKDTFPARPSREPEPPISLDENLIESLIQKYGYDGLKQLMKECIMVAREKRGYSWPEIEACYGVSRGTILAKK